jgi:hypothetical protein
MVYGSARTILGWMGSVKFTARLMACNAASSRAAMFLNGPLLKNGLLKKAIRSGPKLTNNSSPKICWKQSLSFRSSYPRPVSVGEHVTSGVPARPNGGGSGRARWQGARRWRAVVA